VLVIDVMEDPDLVAGWAKKCRFDFPVLLDVNGKVTEQFAPKDAVPDLPRNQVPIASNLIIDPQGRIQFFSLLDSTSFDARLVELQKRLDELLAGEGAAAEAVP
jgi:peroxiredoxin